MRNPSLMAAVLVSTLIVVLSWSGMASAQCNDGDADGYGDPGDITCPGGLADDCDDGDDTIFPGATDVCGDGIDSDCGGDLAMEVDDDADGFAECEGDCNDADALIGPHMTEICDNMINDDCDPGTSDLGDNDGDGFTCDVDCDDTDAAVNPDAIEVCDGVDTDCSGSALPTEVDADGDGWLACIECDDSDASLNLDDADQDGYSTCHDDCDDEDPTRAPGFYEICDGGVDNDCDETTDETVDLDGDGFTACDATPDCGEGDATVYPGAPEVCDGVDNDCDPATDEEVDDDGDTYSECDGDCDDADADVNPEGTEVCNGLDDNCDGSVDEGFDADADGFFDGSDADCLDNYGDDADCDDADSAINPAATEDCEDGIDNDCDDLIDADDTDSCMDQAPIADAGHDQQSRYMAGTVTLRFDGTNSYDPEGADLVYQWEIDGEPDGGVESRTLVTSTNSAYAFLVVKVSDINAGPWDFTLSLKVSEDGNGQESEPDYVQGHIYLDDPTFPPGRCDMVADGDRHPTRALGLLLIGLLAIALRRR